MVRVTRQIAHGLSILTILYMSLQHRHIIKLFDTTNRDLPLMALHPLIEFGIGGDFREAMDI